VNDFFSISHFPKIISNKFSLVKSRRKNVVKSDFFKLREQSLWEQKWMERVWQEKDLKNNLRTC
jgi:hypothetical protein